MEDVAATPYLILRPCGALVSASITCLIRSGTPPSRDRPITIRLTTSRGPAKTPALVGWTPDQITVTTEPNVLVLSGQQAEPDGKQYLYLGISSGGLEGRFGLADYVQVRNARMANGLLTIDLVREVPESLRPRQIQIANTNEPKEIEQKQAA